MQVPSSASIPSQSTKKKLVQSELSLTKLKQARLEAK